MIVRDADALDIDLVSRIGAEGFLEDPVLTWVFGASPAPRAPMLAAFTGMAEGFFTEQSRVVVVDDACAGFWRAPDWVAPPEEPGEGSGPPEVQERFRILGEVMAAAHPHDRPHWYLNVLATLPSRRSQGLGALCLAPVLRTCDEVGTPAYLESSNPRNMGLYRRHGFVELDHTIDLPEGPSLYPMWREPMPR
jgi:GNAT superfamily N-acetyltransferase